MELEQMTEKTGSKIKELFKNKTFVIVAVVVGVLGFVVYKFRGSGNNDSVLTSDIPVSAPDSNESTPQIDDSFLRLEDLIRESSSKQVNTIQDKMNSNIPSSDNEEVVSQLNNISDLLIAQMDKSKEDIKESKEIQSVYDKQVISNAIRDIQDKYKQAESVYTQDNYISPSEQSILNTLHNNAEIMGFNAGLGAGGDTGSLRKLEPDTRVQGVSSIKKQQDAQKKIDDIKQQWVQVFKSGGSEEELNKIHEKAEMIGIEAGLGAGGDDGSQRKRV